MTAAHRQGVLRYLGIWAAWLAVAVVTAFQTYAAGFAGGPKLALGQALVNGVIWYSAWAALTPGVVRVARAFAEERRLGFTHSHNDDAQVLTAIGEQTRRRG